MKIQTDEIPVEGDLHVAEEVAMELHSGASGHIMKLLTNLYKAPEIAALREYAANAWDSHTIAGQTDPVQIKFPTSYNPSFIIQDFGVGMDRDQLKLYGQYGFSSKSATNDENGGFGLGSKVGLALSDQYVVQSVKDGYMNTVVIGLNSLSQPVLKFNNASPVPTTEKNGVKIMIPVPDYRVFSDFDVTDFFVGWAPKSVMVNGNVMPLSVHNPDHFTPIDGFGYLAKPGSVYTRNYYSDVTNRGIGLVGPVRYDIDWSEVSSMTGTLARSYFNNLVLQLPIGSVDLVPSRESLRYTERTKAALNKVVDELVSRGEKTYIKQINEAPTFRDAHKIRVEATSQGFPGSYTYKGVDMTPVNYVSRGDDTQVTWGSLSEVISTSKTTYRVERTRGDIVADSTGVFRRAIRLDYPVLVAGTPSLKTRKSRFSSLVHEGAKITSYLNRALVDDKSFPVGPSAIEVAYTSIPLADLDDAFKGAFVKVFDWDDAKDIAAKKKSAILREARKNAGPRVKKEALDAPIKVVTYSNNGRSYDRTYTLRELDTDQKYILFDQSPEGRMMYRSISTQVGYTENRTLARGLSTLSAAGYTFITYNNSWKTSEYKNRLKNIVDAKDAFYSILVDSYKTFSESDFEAIKSYENGSFNITWAQMFPEDKVDGINRDDTRNWVKSFGSIRSLISRYNKFNELYVSAGALNVDLSGIDIEAKPSSESIGDRYTLLSQLYVSQSTDYNLIVDYINFIDSKE